MAGAFPINWKSGGIGWQKWNGVFSLYICLRFGELQGGQRPIGLVIRFGKRERALYSARRKPWIGRYLQVRAY
jgi:hypothetical protein